MLFQEGRISNLRLRRAVRQAAHTHTHTHTHPHTIAIIPTSSVLQFIVYKRWIMLIQMNCIEFQLSGTLGNFINISTVGPVSHTAAGHRSRYSAARYWSTRQLLLQKSTAHCSRDKYLARPHINKSRRKIYSSHARSAKKQKCKQCYRNSRIQQDEMSLWLTCGT
jgi:hypothetical protein